MKSSTKQSIFWAVSALLIAGVIFLLIYFSAGYLGNAVSNAYDPGRGETLPVSFGLFFSRPLYWKLTLAFLFVLAGLCISCIFRNAKNRILLTVGIEILCVLFVLASQWGVYGKIRWLDLLLCCAGLAAGAGISVFSNRFFRFLQQRYVNMPMHSRQRLEMILDALALGAVIHYAVFRFLQNSMFTFYYSDLYKSITLLLLVFLGGIRFLYIILIKFWQTAQPQRQSFLLLRCAFFISLSIPFFLVGWMHDYKMLFFLPFAALCLYDMDAGKVFRVFAFTIGTLLAATVLCCLAGAVKNVVMAEKGFTGSFGTINTTDFASYFSFLLVTAWCIIKSKKWYASVLFAVFSFAVSFFVFRLTNSRTVLTIGLLTVLLALWNCLEDNVHMKKKKLGWLSKGMDWVSVLAFPLIGAFTVFLVMSYGRQLPWAIQVNEALSGRLSVTWTPYQTYGIHPLGNSIDSMLGFGRTQMSWVLGYSYLDIAYAMLAIRYGWVITGIVAGLWMWMTARAIKSGQKRIALAMVIIAAHAFSEARFLDINYNIFLVMPFCSFSSDRDKVSLLQEQTEKQKLNWFPCIACAVLSGIVYLVLPTALSWLRTFFALMGWNSGTAAWKALMVCTGIVLMLWMIWKVGSLLWATHNKKLAALLAVPVLLLTVGAISASRVIDDGVRNQSTRIAAEEKIIREVLEVADLPVYAAEDSELYQRSIGGLADHIFTTEELGRAPRGSILVDKSVPALALTTAGAKYLQISDWSGLYSFDPAVIDALSKEGFLWQNFYSSKLFCNLKDAAILNGMNADEPLVLHGPVRLVTRNMEMDNIKGVYEVSFTLSDATPSENGQVALLEVLSEAGQKTILQEELSADCFDTDGRCRYAMIYRTISTPLVSFSVSVPEGACVTVEEITVQRVFQKITASGNVSRLIGDASDELSGWMQPRPNSINNAFYIADVILSDAHPGDSYICTAEIEFKNATAVEGKEFALFAKGATNDSGKMKEFWNAKLINLKAAPSNGVYTYTQTYTIPDAVADPSGFYIGFRYDNWASGSFRVKSLTLEKKQ